MATKKRSHNSLVKRKALSNRANVSKKRQKSKNHPSLQIFRRLILVWLVLGLSAIALTARLYVLQVKEVTPITKNSELAKNDRYLRQLAGKTLKEIAASQQNTVLELYTPRRQIVDSQQNVLATDVITYKLYIHPNLFVRHRQKVPPEKVAADLARVIETKTAEELLAFFQNPQNKGIPLPNKIAESQVAKIRALQIDGLDVRRQYTRVYPHREMTAEVTGYINNDEERAPKAGVEYTQNKLLERKPIFLNLKRSFIKENGKGKEVYFPGYIDNSQPLLTSDNLRLQLTLDLRIQQAARAALKKKMDEYQAKRGAVIVMDVTDGSILAMVCQPTYDPNQYQTYSNYSLFKNWAITDLYEPGSTFKPINIAIALDEGAIDIQDIIEDTGEITVGTDTVRNHDFKEVGARGEVTIPEILQNSSNVGMIKIMEKIEPEVYYQRLKQLGIEDKLELEIPWSTAGRLKDKIEFIVRDIEPATAAFGQGFSLTPLKLIQLHAAIANKGNLVTPHVVKGLADFDGYVHYELPKQETNIFSRETSRTVLEMMETVVEKGSGKASKVAGYRIAGKTGTSQKSDSSTGSYAENAKITSFVGIFPVEKPRYAVLAVVDEPEGKYTFGSTVAAPVVGETIKAIIADRGIEPIETNQDSGSEFGEVQ